MAEELQLVDHEGVIVSIVVSSGTKSRLETDLTFATQYNNLVIERRTSLPYQELPEEEEKAILEIIRGTSDLARHVAKLARPATEDNVNSSNVEAFKWNSITTRGLIQLRVDMDEMFKNPPCTKKKLWNRVSVDLEKLHGVKVAGEVCAKKWANLIKRYRAIKDSNTETGAAARELWEFFHVIDAALGDKASSAPASEQLISSSSPPNVLDETPASSLGEPAPKKRQKKEDSLQWLKDYFKVKQIEKKEAMLRKEKADEEKKKREHEKLTVMKTLAQAVLLMAEQGNMNSNK